MSRISFSVSMGAERIAGELDDKFTAIRIMTPADFTFRQNKVK
jgi:hypothetical protein